LGPSSTRFPSAREALVVYGGPRGGGGWKEHRFTSGGLPLSHRSRREWGCHSLPYEKAAEEWAEETGLNVMTIHRFFSVGPQRLTENALRNTARWNPMVQGRIRACITMMLDEAQAISRSTFEAVAAVFAEYALPGCPAGAPFGGRRMYGEPATRRGRSKTVPTRWRLSVEGFTARPCAFC
jgi:hypothetical protein